MTRVLPSPEHGLGPADPAGPVPTGLDGLDYYEMHPARGAVVRVHVEWRSTLWEPEGLPEGVDVEQLQGKRVAQKEFHDGSMDVVSDEWGQAGAVVGPAAHQVVSRRSPGAWRGSTWFFLKGAEPVAGPAQRRYRAKGPPLFVTE